MPLLQCFPCLAGFYTHMSMFMHSQDYEETLKKLKRCSATFVRITSNMEQNAQQALAAAQEFDEAVEVATIVCTHGMRWQLHTWDDTCNTCGDNRTHGMR